MTTNPYATWDEAIAAGRVTDDADGWPDRAMVPVVAELRRQGIVTLQSCAGHQDSDDGHLWTTQPLDVDTAAFSLVRHVTHPEERWEFWWKPADRHRALEALLAARVTTNPTPTPAGAQEGSDGASRAVLNVVQRYRLARCVYAVTGHPPPAHLGDLSGVLNEIEHYVAAILRETAERAWNEGYTSGHSNAMRRMSDEPNAPTSPNPYAAKEADRG